MGHGLIAQHDATRGHEGDDEGGDGGGSADAGPGGRQGVAEIPLDEERDLGPRGRVGGELAVEDEDRAAGAALAQMVVAAAIAEPELEDRPGKVADEAHRLLDAGALREKALDDEIEAAHGSLVAGDAGQGKGGPG